MTPRETVPAGASADAIFDGAVRVWQPRRGYRFSDDALLLAEFAAARAASAGPAANAWDLGAGSGVVALALLADLPGRARAAERAIAVELDPMLAALCRRSAADGGLAQRLTVMEGDLRDLVRSAPRGVADLVVSNPPFHAGKRGAAPPDPQRAAARHDWLCRPGELCVTAAHLCAPGGRVCVVYAAARGDELRVALAAAGLALTRERLVRPRSGAPARLILLEAVPVPRGAESVLPSQPLPQRDELLLHPDHGPGYTPRVESFLRTGAPIKG
ncbi:MAG TPA: methyltransferase [Myxococcota bacterium]|nr:methyltransferase [Myxococcota bacterium]